MSKRRVLLLALGLLVLFVLVPATPWLVAMLAAGRHDEVYATLENDSGVVVFDFDRKPLNAGASKFVGSLDSLEEPMMLLNPRPRFWAYHGPMLQKAPSQELIACSKLHAHAGALNVALYDVALHLRPDMTIVVDTSGCARQPAGFPLRPLSP